MCGFLKKAGDGFNGISFYTDKNHTGFSGKFSEVQACILQATALRQFGMHPNKSFRSVP